MLIHLTSDLSLRPVKLADQPLLQQLMSVVYPQTYTHLWEDGGDWYVANTYSQQMLRKELAENDFYFFVQLDDQPIGILRLEPNCVNPDFPDQKGFKVHRVYLDQKAQGRGVGRALFAYAEQQARQMDFDVFWLETMDTQEASQKFYRKMGLQRGGHITLDFELLYVHLRGMYRMWKKL